MNAEVNATKDQVKEFLDSVLWADIVAELRIWQEGFNMEMKCIVDDAASDNPSTASVLLHMGDLNGRQKAVDYFIGIPNLFLSILEEKQKEKEKDGKDD